MPSCNTYHLTWVSLTLGVGHLLTATVPDLQRGIAPVGPPVPTQPLLLTLEEGYLLTDSVPDLQRGIAPLDPPVPAQPPLLGLLPLAAGPGLGRVWLLSAVSPGFGLGVAPQGHHPWPQA